MIVLILERFVKIIKINEKNILHMFYIVSIQGVFKN